MSVMAAGPKLFYRLAAVMGVLFVDKWESHPFPSEQSRQPPFNTGRSPHYSFGGFFCFRVFNTRARSSVVRASAL